MISEHNKKCCGCGACALKCPVSAITMKYNTEGFLYPVVDMKKCVNCGLCETVCLIDSFSTTINKISPTAFIGYQSDRKNSSSGGIFPLLAQEIIKQGGFVCGALIDAGKLKHVITNQSADINAMRGSKYLQSELGDVYSNIDKMLQDKKTILFIGTPCQVSGLKLFLKRNDPYLFTIDFVCHGVPSPKLFEKYVNERLNSANPITSLTFRDKRKGWHNPSIVVQTINDQYVKQMEDDVFGKAFLSNMILRPSCSTCHFAQYHRCGDITLADAWSIQYVNKKIDNDLGLSLILINSDKGKHYFNKISSKLEYLQSIPKSWAVMANPGLYEPVKEHMCRKRLFNEIKQKHDIIPILSKYPNTENYIALLNFHFENNNYGAVLTAFALNHFLNEKGYFAFNIDYVPSWFLSKKQPPLFEEFRQKYIPRTYRCNNQDDLTSLNHLFDTFIVGSDQVFRHNFTANENGTYYLQFVENNKRKIAYSASFGVDYFEGDEADTFILNWLLHRFDKLSVREKGGVSLIRQVTGLEAEHVLDPVFLLDKQKYIELMGKTTKTNKSISYILNDDVREKINTIIPKIRDIRFGLSIEQWLESFYLAQYIVTDSFHAVCFCLIFEKPFCVVTKAESAVERIQSLFDLFCISKEKILMSSNVLTKTDILNNLIIPTDYNKTLSKLKNKSEKWLMNAIKQMPNKSRHENFFYEYNKNRKKILRRNKIQFKLLNFIKNFTFGRFRKKIKNRIFLIKKMISFLKQNK